MQSTKMRYLNPIQGPIKADLQPRDTGALDMMPTETVDWSFPQAVRGEVTELTIRAIDRELASNPRGRHLLYYQHQRQEVADRLGFDMEAALSRFMVESETQGYSKFVLCHWRGFSELHQAEFPGIGYKISLPLPSLAGVVLGTGGYAVIGSDGSQVGIHFRIGGSDVEHWHLLALNEENITT